MLELALAKNASLEEEAAGLRQALKLAEAAAAAYQDQLAGMIAKVTASLLPDAQPGDRALNNINLLLRRFHSRLSNAQTAAQRWKERSQTGRAAGQADEAGEAAAAEAMAAFESIKRRFGPDWEKGLAARSKQLRRRQAQVLKLEQQLAQLLEQHARSDAAAIQLQKQVAELTQQRQQLAQERDDAQQEAAQSTAQCEQLEWELGRLLELCEEQQAELAGLERELNARDAEGCGSAGEPSSSGR